MKNTTLTAICLLFTVFAYSQSPLSSAAFSSSHLTGSSTMHSSSVVISGMATPPVASVGNNFNTTTFSAGTAPISTSASNYSAAVAEPFSMGTPSIRRDNDDDDDWGGNGGNTGPTSGDPEKNPFIPVGSEWALLVLAITFALLTWLRREKIGLRLNG